MLEVEDHCHEKGVSCVGSMCGRSQSIFVYASLDIAEHHLTQGPVVREVAKGLKRVAPEGALEAHLPTVVVEPLEVPDERLDQALLARGFASPDSPDLGNADHDGQVDDSCGVPVIDDLLRPLDCA